MVSKPVTIAGIAFPTMGAAITHAQTILYAGPPGTEITGSDAEFVEALLGARADKLLDLQGMNVIRYLRDWQDQTIAERDWTVCFWAELEDGTRVHFSFKKAIRMLGDEQQGAVPGS